MAAASPTPLDEIQRTLDNLAYPITTDSKTPVFLAAWMLLLLHSPPLGDETSIHYCEGCADPRRGPPTCSGAFRFIVGRQQAEDTADSTITLPCGCRWRLGCLEYILHPNEPGYNYDDCPSCGFQLFQRTHVPETEPWSLDAWMSELETVDLNQQEGTDECGICRLEYVESSQPDVVPNDDDFNCAEPVKLHCGHVYGRACIALWLSPNPGGGNGHTCPMCRAVLFPPWPSPEDLEYDIESDPEEGREDEEEMSKQTQLFWERCVIPVCVVVAIVIIYCHDYSDII